LDPQLIITHAGGAHFDDVTAVSLILARHPEAAFVVERREPALAELDNPEIWVVDTGNRHEPEKRNFDHHQSLASPAAFVLVAQYLGLAATMAVMPWWHFKDEVDRFGPARSSAKYGAGDDLINRNPVETWLTDSFAAGPETMLPQLKSYGTHLIESAVALKRQIDFWKGSRRLTIAGVTAIIGETRESVGLEEFRRQDEHPPDIVISLDRRDDGWRLFRFDGAPVDFTLLSGRPEIGFVHKSGFLARTRERLDTAALVALVSRAVTRS
jgi:hypothetical protein